MIYNAFFGSHTPQNFIKHDEKKDKSVVVIKKKRGRQRKKVTKTK